MDASFSSKSPIFTGSNYGVWAVKMKIYLKAFDLWEDVEADREVVPLNNNPTMAQIKYFHEQRAKKFKALTCIHNAVSEDIFTRIMACETAKDAWDKLKSEFQGDEKSKRMQILNLKRQFEGLKMKDSDTIKDFSSNISKIVNQMTLLGEEIQESRVVEKVLVSLPEKFENKICSLEDSKDFSELSLQELVNALQAVEQRQQFRQENSGEEAFAARFKGRSKPLNVYKNSEPRTNSSSGKPWQNKNWQGNQTHANNFYTKGKERREQFPTCKYCQKTNHLESFCWLKNAQCRKCKQFGHIQKFCKNNTSGDKQAHVAEAMEPKEEQLFTAIVEHNCNTTEVSKQKWLIDSGCSNHMAAEPCMFENLDLEYKSKVKVANGQYVSVEGRGEVDIETLAGTRKFKHVLYVPEIDQKLISVGQLLEVGYSLFFDNGMCTIKDDLGIPLFTTKMNNRCFSIDEKQTHISMNISASETSSLWHRRMGHFNYATLKKMAELQVVEGLPMIHEQDKVCEACQLGKQSRAKFNNHALSSTTRL